MVGIYWDCDGTLMDTERAYAYAWQEVLSKRSLNLPIETFDDYVGIDDRLVHKKYAKEVSLPSFSETMDEIAALIINNFSDHTIYQDSLSCLNYFHDLEWSQACVSASPQKALEDKLTQFKKDYLAQEALDKKFTKEQEAYKKELIEYALANAKLAQNFRTNYRIMFR